MGKVHEGKVVLVTGGTRGIGRAIVRRFVEEGASRVYFTFRSAEEQARSLEEETGGIARGFRADVSDFPRMEEVVESIVKETGSIDVLVNNAGIAKDNLLLRMKNEEWRAVLSVNLDGAMVTTRAALRSMLRKRSGSIIFISSIIGIMGNAGQSNYAASKAALIGFAKALAREVGSRNIRVNVVAPGFIQTEMTEKIPEEVRKRFLEQTALRRFGKPEEVASVVSFLASEDASYITGQVIVVCGGYLIC